MSNNYLQPSSFAIQERRDNRRGFVENIFKGKEVPVSINKTVSIIDAMKLLASHNDEFKNFYKSDFTDAQMKKLWLNGDLSAYSSLIHRSVLAMADQYIGPNYD